MLRHVLKYSFEGSPILVVPSGRIVYVGAQDGIPTVWVEHWVIDFPSTHLRLRLHGTGSPTIGENEEHAGTVQVHGLVWHVYYSIENGVLE